jgi:hypothetical protein
VISAELHKLMPITNKSGKNLSWKDFAPKLDFSQNIDQEMLKYMQQIKSIV